MLNKTDRASTTLFGRNGYKKHYEGQSILTYNEFCREETTGWGEGVEEGCFLKWAIKEGQGGILHELMKGEVWQEEE